MSEMAMKDHLQVKNASPVLLTGEASQINNN